MAEGSNRDLPGSSGITSEFLENFSRIPVNSVTGDPDAMLAWRLQNEELNNDIDPLNMPSRYQLPTFPPQPNRLGANRLTTQRHHNNGRSRRAPFRGNLTIINNEPEPMDVVDSVNITEHGRPIAQPENNDAGARFTGFSPYTSSAYINRGTQDIETDSDTHVSQPSDAYSTIDTTSDHVIARELLSPVPDIGNDEVIAHSMRDSNRLADPDSDELIARQLGQEINEGLEQRDCELALRLEREERSKSRKDEENRQNRNNVVGDGGRSVIGNELRRRTGANVVSPVSDMPEARRGNRFNQGTGASYVSPVSDMPEPRRGNRFNQGTGASVVSPVNDMPEPRRGTRLNQGRNQRFRNRSPTPEVCTCIHCTGIHVYETVIM